MRELFTCPDDATLDANLLQVYHMASQDVIDRGVHWYRDAHHTCVALSRRYATPVHVVAAIVAVLSPSVEWHDDVAAAEAILSRSDTMINRKGNVTPILGYGRNIHKARTMRETYDLSVMKGPKVWRFFGNIMNLTHDAVVDVHATQAALLSTVHDGPGRHYHRIADAYARCAASVGIDVPDFQAIIWITWKKVKRGYR